MWVQLIAGGILAASYIYHRWFEKPDFKDKPPNQFSIPRTEAGAAVPLLYGRVRTTEPVLAWGAVVNVSSGQAICKYHFVLGIGMEDGASTNTKVTAWYLGELRFPSLEDGDLSYSGTPAAAFPGGFGDILVEQLLGGSSQVIVNATDGHKFPSGPMTPPASTTPPTYLGRTMMNLYESDPSDPLNEALYTWPIEPKDVAGFRGYVSCHLGSLFQGSGLNVTANPEAISFEAYSYPSSGVGQIGQDCNPVDVILDLLNYNFGKLGIPWSQIDSTSFANAWATLKSESHGYSRVIQAAEADQHFGEILEQIDGVLRENPKTGKLELKLIRNDYDPATIPHITKANCEEIQNLAIGGWQGVPNKIKIVFTDRANGYRDGSAIAHNQANALGQDGAVREQTIRMPGVCYQSLADALAARELAARSRPITKLRAICDRSMRDLMPGDAVKLTWTDPDIAGLVFRVANVDKGTLADGKIALDLISDYFYVWRNQVPLPPDLGGVRVDLGIHIVMG